MEIGSKHGRVIPTNFGLKYNPPKLGIQYYFRENPKATFVHEITLDFVEQKANEELVNDLFSNHKKFIDPKVVSRNQIENLMDRLKSHASIENLHEHPLDNILQPQNNAMTNNNISAKAEAHTKALDDDWGLELDDHDVQKDELMQSNPLGKQILNLH